MDHFILNGKTIFYEDLKRDLTDPGVDDFQLAVFDFIKKWELGQDTFSVRTSGSTGPPKELTFTRQQMRISAERTIAYFGLRPGDTVLLCLHPSYIAGKMMLTRALVGDLKLVCITPTVNPFKRLDTKQEINFAAVTPMQMEAAVNETPEKIHLIKHILIGGAGIHAELERRLRRVSNSMLYHSFSMTETLTHIAIRRINSRDYADLFKLLDGISISTDDRSCLVINDLKIKLDKIVTNDIVEIVDSSSFRWIGRYDLIVNSGGIKIQIEELEQRIMDILKSKGLDSRFCLLAMPDPRFTEMLVLLLEQGAARELETSRLLEMLKRELPKFHAPRKIVRVSRIFMTNTGKVDRIRNAEEYINKKAKKIT